MFYCYLTGIPLYECTTTFNLYHSLVEMMINISCTIKSLYYNCLHILFCFALISVLFPQDVYRAHTLHSADTGATIGGTIGVFIAVIIIGGSLLMLIFICICKKDVSGSELTHTPHTIHTYTHKQTHAYTHTHTRARTRSLYIFYNFIVPSFSYCLHSVHRYLGLF